MPEVASLTYNQLEFKDDTLSFDYLLETMKHMPYSSELSRGFQSVSGGDAQISATFVKRTPTSIAQFNPEKREFVDTTVYLYQRVPFTLYYANGIVEVYGNSEHSAAIRSLVRQLFGSKSLRIQPILLNPTAIVVWMQEQGIHCSLPQMTILNFRHQVGIIGTYSLRAVSSDLIARLLTEYENDIARLTIHVLDLQAGEFSIVASNSGTIRVSAPDSNLIEAIALVKRVVEGITQGRVCESHA